MARRYEFYVRVAETISHLTSEGSSLVRYHFTPGQLSVIFSHANVAKDGGLAVDFTGRPGN